MPARRSPARIIASPLAVVPRWAIEVLPDAFTHNPERLAHARQLGGKARSVQGRRDWLDQPMPGSGHGVGGLVAVSKFEV